MKTSEVLRKAADEIRRRGWHQGSYGNNLDTANCKVCSMGALHAATTGDPWNYDRSADEAGRALYRAIGNFNESVVTWNDDPGRTVEEVLDAFERAATLAEQSGE